MLQDFRTLGGVADNVRIGTGARGRGIFPIDSTLPISLRIPASLMIGVADTQLRNGELVVRLGAARKRETKFFDEYQRAFGWSAGAYDDALAQQRAWHELPEEIVTCLRAICAADVLEKRFDAPSPESALSSFGRSRGFHYDGRARFIPVIELVNHQSTANGFVVRDYVGVEGTFPDEVLVSYDQLFDAMSVALSWGFFEEANCANSLGMELGYPDGMQLAIGRSFNKNRVSGGLVFPNAEINRNVIKLPFLALGNIANPTAPRTVFREVMRPRMTGDEADRIFNGIVDVNNKQLTNLLELASTCDSPVARVLGYAAEHQLKLIAQARLAMGTK